MQVQMGKWRLGILVLVLVTVGLFGYVVYLGVQSKQDRATVRAAEAAAVKLNGYIDSQQQLPNSLAQAGVQQAPAALSYTKKSDSSYEFCVTYKTAGVNVGSDVQQGLTMAATEQVLGSSFSSFGTSNAKSRLVISSSHKAGRQCQTVTPQLDNFSNPFSSSASSSSDGRSSSDQFNFGASTGSSPSTSTSPTPSTGATPSGMPADSPTFIDPYSGKPTDASGLL